MPDIAGALEHHQAGRLQEAEAAYRDILAQDPEHVRALHLLGTICLQTGRYDEATVIIRRALELEPGYANARNNLGLVYQARGDADPASDIDVLIVLQGPVHPSDEVARTGEIVAELSLQFDTVVSCLFMDESRFAERNGPLLRNVRREGLAV